MCHFFTETVVVSAFFMIICLSYPAINAETITEGPVPVTALIGTNSQFHCAGTGNYLVWEVDGLQIGNSDIVSRGITEHTIPSSGTVQSNLTVPATSENNGTTVRCAISVSLFSTPAISNYSTLTVLPGIGHVLNLRFNPSFTQVLWGPPSTAGVLSNLYYHVTLMNNVNTDLIINKTTDNTYYPLPTLQPCQYYTAHVTAFSAEYHGESVVNKQRVIGENYTVQIASQDVVVNPDGVSPSVVVLVMLKIMLPGSVRPCFGQWLTFATYPQSNTSDITTHPDYDIVTTGDILYSITDGIVKKLLYTAVISHDGSEGAVSMLKFNFSSFAIQHCDVHTDHTSYILVECTFAINSTAPGFVLIQDEHSQYTINTTLQRHEGDVRKGSVNITDLPAGEYRVTVYDEMEESSMEDMVAYKHPISLQISQIHNPHPSSTLSVSSVHQTGSSPTAVYSSMNTKTESPSIPPTTTPQPPSSLVSVLPVVVGVVSTGVIIITVIVVTVCMLIVAKHKHRKNSLTPINHVCRTPTTCTTESRYVGKKDLKELTSTGGEYMARTDRVSSAPAINHVMAQQLQKKPEVVYAEVRQSTNPPAAPPPTQPVVYAEVRQSTNPPAAPPHTQPVVYAEVKQSTNPPAAPPPTQPVVYAEVKQSTNTPAAPPPTQPVVYSEVQQQQNQALLYADLYHSHTHPVAAPPVQPEKVVYAVVNSRTTDKTTGDSLCTKHTGKGHLFTDGSGQKYLLSSSSSASSGLSSSSDGYSSDRSLLPPSDHDDPDLSHNKLKDYLGDHNFRP